MQISAEQVAKIAELAQVQLQAEEVEALPEQLSRVLAFMSSLATLELEERDGLLEASSCPERDDEVRAGLSPSQALKNAPDCAGTAFKVPRIVE